MALKIFTYDRSLCLLCILIWNVDNYVFIIDRYDRVGRTAYRKDGEVLLKNNTTGPSCVLVALMIIECMATVLEAMQCIVTWFFSFVLLGGMYGCAFDWLLLRFVPSVSDQQRFSRTISFAWKMSALTIGGILIWSL
jgi:hypothetical protein